MSQSDLEAAMQKAIAALGRPCISHITDRNLIPRRPDGWWGIGTVSVPEERKAWQVFWHPERQQGWLWWVRNVAGGGVQPRRFDPPD